MTYASFVGDLDLWQKQLKHESFYNRNYINNNSNRNNYFDTNASLHILALSFY